MIPKKSSAIYKELVEEIDVPLELVEDLVQAYYKTVRNELTNLTEPRINVEGLGQFVARPALVKKSITRYTNMLDHHDTSTFKAYYNKKMLEEKLDKLKSLDAKLDVQDLKKQEFIKTSIQLWNFLNSFKQKQN